MLPGEIGVVNENDMYPVHMCIFWIIGWCDIMLASVLNKRTLPEAAKITLMTTGNYLYLPAVDNCTIMGLVAVNVTAADSLSLSNWALSS